LVGEILVRYFDIGGIMVSKSTSDFLWNFVENGHNLHIVYTATATTNYLVSDDLHILYSISSLNYRNKFYRREHVDVL
jgi:hypothetical protein